MGPPSHAGSARTESLKKHRDIGLDSGRFKPRAIIFELGSPAAGDGAPFLLRLSFSFSLSVVFIVLTATAARLAVSLSAL